MVYPTALVLILQIIGAYGIAMGFVQKSDLPKDFGWLDDMTSPNPGRFVAANIRFLGLLWLLGSIGFGDRSRGNAQSWGCFGQILILCVLSLFCLYVLAHLIVICPFAYIGSLFSSALVASITGSAGDIEMTSSKEKVRVREIVASNPAAAKSFLVGIPAIVLALVTKVIGIFSN